VDCTHYSHDISPERRVVWARYSAASRWHSEALYFRVLPRPCRWPDCPGGGDWPAMLRRGRRCWSNISPTIPSGPGTCLTCKHLWDYTRC